MTRRARRNSAGNQREILEKVREVLSAIAREVKGR